MTFSLVRHLRELDVDAGLILTGVAREPTSALRESGVPLVALGHSRGRTILRSLGSFTEFYEAALTLGPDAIVLPNTGFLAPALHVRGYRGKIVSIEHGKVGHVESSRGLKGLKRRLEWQLSSRSIDMQVAVSKDLLEQIRHSGAKQKAFIHNGIELPDLHIREVQRPERGFTCAILSRLVAGKGVDVAIRAMARLADVPQVKLLVCGDGDMRQALETLARELGVSDKVEFVGWTTPERTWTRANLGLALSDKLIEGFGMSAMEAMSYGLPIIASRNGALPEFVKPEENGVLVEPGDDLAVASAIRRYIGDPKLYIRHSSCAAATARKFDILEVAVKYRALLVAVCSAGSTHEAQ